MRSEKQTVQSRKEPESGRTFGHDVFQPSTQELTLSGGGGLGYNRALVLSLQGHVSPQSLSDKSGLSKGTGNFDSLREGPLSCSVLLSPWKAGAFVRCISLMQFRLDPERPHLAVQSKKVLRQGAPPTTSSTWTPSQPASLSVCPPGKQHNGGDGAHWSGRTMAGGGGDFPLLLFRSIPSLWKKWR